MPGNAGNSDQDRLRILKQEIEKQKKIAAERKKAIEEKEREKRRLERLAREAREREQRMRRREELYFCGSWILDNGLLHRLCIKMYVHKKIKSAFIFKYKNRSGVNKVMP